MTSPIFEPAHDKAYNETCATSEDSDQPAYPRSLIRVFADRMSLKQPPGYPKRDEREPLPYRVDVQADPVLCWSHRCYCRPSHALALLLFFKGDRYPFKELNSVKIVLHIY